MTAKTESYEVTFDVLMPGAQKKTQYTIAVDAGNHADALVAAESKYLETVLTYDIRSRKTTKSHKGPSEIVTA